MDQGKYSAPSDSKTVHDLSLSHMDAEDTARREPQVGVGKVDRLADAGSMLQLFDKKKGYDTMVGF